MCYETGHFNSFLTAEIISGPNQGQLGQAKFSHEYRSQQIDKLDDWTHSQISVPDSIIR